MDHVMPIKSGEQEPVTECKDFELKPVKAPAPITGRTGPMPGY
jgi:hypothetical protein